MAMTVFDLIPPVASRRCQRPVGPYPMPELVYFIQKITFHAGINVRTALVALIYLNRAKEALPKNAVGGYDTCHRLFLASILLASKMLRDTTWCPSSNPNQWLLSSVPSTWSHYYSFHSANVYCHSQLTNRRLCDMCGGLYTVEDINQLERAFLKLIQYRCWVDDQDVSDFVLKHRVDLSL
ncbi:hypothetical protein EC973_002543 [Apophysomyces ossiformis]|uniref:Cyclin N-terminal domain-containing protein n=1 Tax=Apophysomyces ossiformis TaxID=679940 RepID=A0A8H7BTW7_9FUNG|nr:hypothetical protein EC973_002543 [Apophysomyces ossiformis]